MDELLLLLEQKFPSIDFKKEKNLVSKNILDSLDIVELLVLLRDHYNINIKINDIEVKNFESVDSILSMVRRLKSTP